jgi:hypothetical protein
MKVCRHRWVDPANQSVESNGYRLRTRCGKLKRPRRLPDGDRSATWPRT